MRKLFCFILMMSLFFSVCYGAEAWRNGTGEESVLGSENASSLDDAIYDNIVLPLDTLLSNYQEGCKISYASTSTISVGAGEIAVSNSGGTIRLMLKNAAATTVTFADDMDTGNEAGSTTYYLWAFQETTSDTDFDVCISTSSSTPSGKTYYARLGSFYNDSSSNIVNDNTIVNDYETAAKQFGTWVSKSADTSYLASSDGIVCASSEQGTSKQLFGYTDSSNPPTTQRVREYTAGADSEFGSITMPVKKGDYYKVTGSVYSMFWIPNN